MIEGPAEKEEGDIRLSWMVVGDKCRHPRSLSDEQRRTVLDVLHADRFVDKPPATVYATLLPEFRRPFDMIADAATACAEKEAAGGSSDDLCQLMGG